MVAFLDNAGDVFVQFFTVLRSDEALSAAHGKNYLHINLGVRIGHGITGRSY